MSEVIESFMTEGQRQMNDLTRSALLNSYLAGQIVLNHPVVPSSS